MMNNRVEPCDLPNGIHPCGYDRKNKKLKEILQHYRQCPDEWCQWRAGAAREMATKLAESIRKKGRD